MCWYFTHNGRESSNRDELREATEEVSELEGPTSSIDESASSVSGSRTVCGEDRDDKPGVLGEDGLVEHGVHAPACKL